MHFASGVTWFVVYDLTLPWAEVWTSLLLLTLANLAFEFAENNESTGAIMWGWTGAYKQYEGDNCANVLGDILCVTLGWACSKLGLVALEIDNLALVSTETLFYFLALGVMFVTFVACLRQERRYFAQQRMGDRGPRPLPLVTASA